MTIILVVLLLVMIVQGGRWVAARWAAFVTGTGFPPEENDELPADYGMSPERPWERRQRRRARLARGA